MRTFFALVAFFFFASLGSATILGPLGQQYPGYCTGTNSPACPGAIEVLQPTDPGTLWATGSSTIQDAGRPGVPAIGKLTSAAFRQDEGVAAYTFYYQLTLYNTDLYPIKLFGLDLFSGWDSRRAISFADVAVRTDGLGTVGNVNFVASSLLPSSISLSPVITTIWTLISTHPMSRRAIQQPQSSSEQTARPLQRTPAVL